jgi:hypothetical protein
MYLEEGGGKSGPCGVWAWREKRGVKGDSREWMLDFHSKRPEVQPPCGSQQAEIAMQDWKRMVIKTS